MDIYNLVNCNATHTLKVIISPGLLSYRETSYGLPPGCLDGKVLQLPRVSAAAVPLRNAPHLADHFFFVDLQYYSTKYGVLLLIIVIHYDQQQHPSVHLLFLISLCAESRMVIFATTHPRGVFLISTIIHICRQVELLLAPSRYINAVRCWTTNNSLHYHPLSGYYRPQ